MKSVKHHFSINKFIGFFSQKGFCWSEIWREHMKVKKTSQISLTHTFGTVSGTQSRPHPTLPFLVLLYGRYHFIHI